MKLSALLITMSLFACNSKKVDSNLAIQDKPASDSVSHQNSFSPESRLIFFVDSPKYASLLNNARWLMYCIECDKRPKWLQKYSNVPPSYFGSLCLKYEKTREFGDTVELYLRFYLNDTMPCKYGYIENYYTLIDGIAFDKVNSKRIYYIKGDGNIVSMDPNSRYGNELQPEVISFIRKNSRLLNPSFYDQANSKGLLH